jgi:nucleoid-associated protein YgaU
MSVSITSRYYQSPVYDATDAEGVTHATVAIRQPTPPTPGTTMYRHTVTAVETIEYLAWRYYGNSALWWRIAEANDLIFATDIVPGSVLNIPGARDIGTIVRNRSFS